MQSLIGSMTGLGHAKAMSDEPDLEMDMEDRVESTWSSA